ncbi:MAG: hypothetical protein II349_05645 [Akkermansia sp.]|nr:hypothetical protein [Akkermansia sp.]
MNVEKRVMNDNDSTKGQPQRPVLGVEVEDEPLPPPFDAAPVSPVPESAPETAKVSLQSVLATLVAKMKGAWLAISLGIGAAVAAALAVQFQGHIERIEQNIAQHQQELVACQEQTKKELALLAETKVAAQQVEETRAQMEQAAVDCDKARAEYRELAPLRYNSLPFDELMARGQSTVRQLEVQIEDLDTRKGLYLPPEKLTTKQLRERAAYLKKYVELYLRARTIGCTVVLHRMCADVVEHYACGMQRAESSEVAQLLDRAYTRERVHASYRLHALGFNGLTVELVSEVTVPGLEPQWSKETWKMNEAGAIVRWAETLSSGEPPTLSQGFCRVKCKTLMK